jgi:HD-like signal output (HDOD) protein
MNSADVLAQIETIGELPILPHTLLQIQKVATDDRSSADDLAQVILRDQSLTMRVLRMVNSAMYQRRGREKVTTVRRAVIVLGFETVRKLALGLSVFDMMSKLSRSPHLMQVTRHSLITAAFAQRLAEASGRVPPEEAFVTALIHDVGKVVLIECSPAAYDQVLDEIAQGAHTIDAERKHFGMSHDRAGRRLAARWKLPTSIQTVIGDHHDFDPLHPPRQLDPQIATIIYADAMSRFTFSDESQAREMKVLNRAGKVLGIPLAQLDDLYQQIDHEISQLASAVDVSMGDLRSFGVLVNAEGSATVAPPMSEEEKAERTARQLELYRAIGTGVASGRRPKDLLREILDGVVQVLGLERVILFRVNHDRRELRPMIWQGAGMDDPVAELTLPLRHDTGAVALCALQRRPFHVPAARSEAYEGQAGAELLERTKTCGFACAPVTSPDGVAAVLFADHGPDGADCAFESAQELNGLAAQIGLVLQSALVKV